MKAALAPDYSRRPTVVDGGTVNVRELSGQAIEYESNYAALSKPSAATAFS